MHLLLSILVVSLVVLVIPSAFAENVPDWVKNNAGWWATDQIDDSSFLQGIQYLIKEGIMVIPPTETSESAGSHGVPSWIKNNAGWWASDQIPDSAFLQGIQYLIKEGIIKVQPSAATPTQVPPTTTPVPNYLLNFEDLEKNVTEVSRIAWEDSQRILSLNSDSFSAKTDLVISVGPTTKPYSDNYEQAFQKAIIFWSNFDQPTKYWALMYNYEDKSWAKEEIEKASFLEHKDLSIVDAPCHGTICTGANSGIEAFSSVGLGVFGINQPDSSDPYRYGPIQIHEYTHSVAAAPWIGDDHPNSGPQKTGPCWLSEGQGHFAGFTVGTDSYEDYLKLRATYIWNELFSERPRVPSFNDFSPSKIIEYYDNSVPNECLPPNEDYDLGYSLGFLTVEALSAIGGSDSSMNLYKLMKNNSFPEAFELTYGYPWDEAKKIIASVVSSNILDIEKNISKFR